MTKTESLIELLQQDVFTDAAEYAERVSEIRRLIPVVAREVGEFEERVAELQANLSATDNSFCAFVLACGLDKTPITIDTGASVVIERDGDRWCAKRQSFKNLMENSSGFGGTPIEAIANLVFNEGVELMKQNATRNEELHLQGFATDHIWAMEDTEGFIGLRMDCGDSGTVYLTSRQAEEVIGCLQQMLSGQSAFQTMRKSAAERLAQFIAKKESGNCKTLEEALHHQSNWQRIIPQAEEMLKAAFPETAQEAQS